ncbi:splicing regulator SDE2-like isoform X2 [Artemia franciscana]|uniref:Replication stress response regulator SDE2 n=1 Tax=Artemia franciscana TaxID=6661 RepID=A0AA88HFD5_ARTSF|nr:hypothetical protein QYM36_015677 [Artemia franciscana]
MYFLKNLTGNEYFCLSRDCSTPYEAMNRATGLAVPESAYETLKFKVSGKIINIHDRLPVIGEDNVCFIEAFIPFVGGKGGFGSMLRAIGAQIEKTTNREACRDLSGRRIRDINEEKRLKDWIAKKADREKEKQERKKAKLEKLCQETKHEFHDPTYDKQRSEISDKVYESVEKAMNLPSTSSAAIKRKNENDETKVAKKKYLWTGVDDDSDSSIDSEAETGEASVEAEPCLTSESSSTSVEAVTAHHIEENVEPGVTVKTEASVSQVESEENEPVQNECNKNPVFSIVSPEDVKPEFDGEIALPTTETTEEHPVRSSDIKKEVEEICLEMYNSAEELEPFGLETLKIELQRRGMKCGGSLNERASRLFSVKGVSLNEIPPSLLVGGNGKKKRNGKC